MRQLKCGDCGYTICDLDTQAPKAPLAYHNGLYWVCAECWEDE